MPDTPGRPNVDEKTLRRRFGEAVRRRRNALGVGQEAMADRAGIHRTHLSLLERGLRSPTLPVIDKVARALDTTMSDLLADVEREEDTPEGK